MYVHIIIFQFRAISDERGAFAFWPFGRARPSWGQTEHWCFGGVTTDNNICGDITIPYSPTGNHAWQMGKTAVESVYMIFYR